MIMILATATIAIIGVITLISTIYFYMSKKKQEIDDIFSSDEMRKGMMNLRHFVEDNQTNFEDVFRDLLDKRNQKGNEISLDSGHFFHLLRKKLFNNREKPRKWLIKHTMDVATIKFLLEVVDPLEKVKAEKNGAKHADYIAKKCERIFKKELEMNAMAMIKQYDELVKKYKSELKEKTKHHDALVKLMKLPKTFDKAITVEQSSKLGKSHLYNQIVVDIPGDKFPRLYFDMKVVNRTCLHSFEAEEIEINCFCGGEPVCSSTWNKKTGQPKPEAFDEFSDLPRFEDGTIELHIPLEKQYDNLEKWDIRGTAKYRAKEPMIEDNTQYASPKIGIHLEYVLSEKQIPKLKKEVDKALGKAILC